ncbi:MAG: tetraacyldisaccharide 4'-kinase [Candidatus Babeliales bacterium]|jgi:tetraacyldisaccharide 4'-kinase
MMRFILYFFYPIELLYRFGFWIALAYRKRNANKDQFPFKIISVGNLAVGGTGKSVVVPFLVDILGRDGAAIVLRGYRGALEREGRVALVNNGAVPLVTREQSGDEAMMYVEQLGIPVAVGAHRAQACKLLPPKIKHVVLDDAYQNYSVRKDVEILLLDARSPFDNGHCLPLGRLREKDYTRADIIILTHADGVDSAAIEYIKNTHLKDFPHEKIFTGKHAYAGLYCTNKDLVMPDDMKRKKFLIAAGIGSFKGFVTSVKNAGYVVGATKKYKDHHNYTAHDVRELGMLMQQTQCDGIITTAKDWVKLESLVAHNAVLKKSVFVIRVEFKLLTQDQSEELQHALHVLLNR